MQTFLNKEVIFKNTEEGEIIKENNDFHNLI